MKGQGSEEIFYGAEIFDFSYKQRFLGEIQLILRLWKMKSKLGDKRSKMKQMMEAKNAEIKGTLLMGRYQLQSVIGKGVSSVVYQGIDKKTSRKVAVKKITKFLDNKQESLRILRQLILLRILDHPNIIKLRDIILQEIDGKKQLNLVLDYLPFDVTRLYKSIHKFTFHHVKSMVFQILCGLNYCHQSQVLHRDLKPENILVTDDLSEVKLCDFGLARAVMSQEPTMTPEQVDRPKKDLQSKEDTQSTKAKVGLTAHVTTRWYRAPELIILQKKYDSAIDMWSVGCILAQLLGMLKENSNAFTERKVLFPGKACYPLSPPKNNETNYKKINDFPHSVSDQLSKIFQVLGTPDDISFITDERARNYIKSFGKIEKKPFNKIFDFIPQQVSDFLQKSLRFNPSTRLTIGQAIKHPLFDGVREQFQVNANIVGEPVITDIEDLSKEQIEERVQLEFEYYQKLNSEQN